MKYKTDDAQKHYNTVVQIIVFRVILCTKMVDTGKGSRWRYQKGFYPSHASIIDPAI